MHKDCNSEAEVVAGSNRLRMDCHMVAAEPGPEPSSSECDRQVLAEESDLQPIQSRFAGPCIVLHVQPFAQNRSRLLYSAGLPGAESSRCRTLSPQRAV